MPLPLETLPGAALSALSCFRTTPPSLAQSFQSYLCRRELDMYSHLGSLIQTQPHGPEGDGSREGESLITNAALERITEETKPGYLSKQLNLLPGGKKAADHSMTTATGLTPIV